MPKAVIVFLVLLIAAIWFAQYRLKDDEPSFASDSGVELSPGATAPMIEQMRDREEPRASDRLRAIQQELLELAGHPWAGVYAWDDDRGGDTRISIAPRSGFTFFRSSPQGVVDVNHGDIEAVDEEHVKIALAIDPRTGEHDLYLGESIATLWNTLCFVRWGERRYLIPTPQMQRFCNLVNDGSEARKPRFPVRLDGSQAAEVSGVPTVPAVWRNFVFATPVETTIVGIQPDPDAEDGIRSRLSLPREVTIAAGADRRLQKGMVVWATESPAFGEGEVIEVANDRSTVRFHFALEGHADIEPLKVGMSVSTRRPTFSSAWIGERKQSPH